MLRHQASDLNLDCVGRHVLMPSRAAWQRRGQATGRGATANVGVSIMKRLAMVIASACLIASMGAFAGAMPKQSTGTRTNQTPTTVTPTTVHGPVMTGQPKQSCGSPGAPNTPGNAASAPGSAFNPDGNAGTHYAGQQPQNSRNTASVAQYDVACSNQPH